MGNIFTLDSMREEIEREFAPCQFEIADGKVVTLRNLMRLNKKVREQVYKLLDAMTENQKDEEVGALESTEKSAQIALGIIPLVADDPKLGAALAAAIEDDLALTLRVFSTWMEGTQAGEAESLDS